MMQKKNSRPRMEGDMASRYVAITVLKVCVHCGGRVFVANDCEGVRGKGMVTEHDSQYNRAGLSTRNW